MHWLTMRLERIIPATEMFPTFRQYVLVTQANAESLIRELCADATIMRSFDTPEPGTPEAEFFGRLGPLDAGTVLPLILLLFRSGEVTTERRRRALRILESWLARRALMRLTAKNYNGLVPRLVARVKRDLLHADDVLLESLAGGEGEISRWPEDQEFKDFLRNYGVYGVVGQPRLIMALAAVEGSLYSNKTDIPGLAEGLSLEHLLPQDWETYWPVVVGGENNPADLDDEKAIDARRSRLHRLGNLTIVTQALNSSLSNGPWENKRKALNAESKLLINARLIEMPAWDVDAIDARGAWLADRLAAIWPGPTASSW